MSNKIWITDNPDIPGSYICRMDNGYIKMCYWDGEEWGDMWRDGLDGEVSRWMEIPYDEEEINCAYDETWEEEDWTDWDEEENFKTFNEAPYGDD
jgi:hypothetical protein